MFTMSEADTGNTTSATTVKIDLSNYALSSETATKVDLEALQKIVANKLDRNQCILILFQKLINYNQN